MTARHTHLAEVQAFSNELVEAGNYGSEQIVDRNNEISAQWESLIDLAGYRKKRLNEAVDFYQVRGTEFSPRHCLTRSLACDMFLLLTMSL